MTSETHFFLVRHGETDFNLQGMVQGRGVDTPLNETGIRQAQALAGRFSTIKIDAIYSSPLIRALQTARCVAQTCGELPVGTNPGLEEMSWGIFEGQSHSDELASAFDEMKTRWHHGEHDFRVEGGESLLDVQARGLDAMEDIHTNHIGQHVLVVAHGRFLRILLASLLEEYGVKRMEELTHTNTGVNHLVHDGTRFVAKLLNCTEHLK